MTTSNPAGRTALRSSSCTHTGPLARTPTGRDGAQAKAPVEVSAAAPAAGQRTAGVVRTVLVWSAGAGRASASLPGTDSRRAGLSGRGRTCAACAGTYTPSPTRTAAASPVRNYSLTRVPAGPMLPAQRSTGAPNVRPLAVKV